MIEKWIGAGADIAGTLITGLKGLAQKRKLRKELEAEQRRTDDYYRRRLGEDPVATTEAREALKGAGEQLEAARRDAAGRSMVRGSSIGAEAAERTRGVKALGDTAAQIESNAARRHDEMERQYRDRLDRLRQMLTQL